MKYRRLIAAVLLPLTFSLVTGCYSIQGIPPEDLRPATPLRYAEAVKGIVTLSGREVRFDDPVEPLADTLHARVNGEPFTIALDQVDRVLVRREWPSPALTGPLVIAGIIVSVVFVATMIAFSEGWKSSPVR